MKWFEAMGVWGWVILVVAAPLFLTSIASTFIRIPRKAALLLLVGCGLPAFVGIAGMFHGRMETDRVVATLTPPQPELRAEGYAEAQYCLWFGLAAMFACDVAAIAALLRSKVADR